MATSDAVFAGISPNGHAGNTITITNTATGTISAGSYPYHAIVTYGAATTITNAGTIEGNLQLATAPPLGSSSTSWNTFTITATGEWLMQGNSNFGANTESKDITTLNNSGLVIMSRQVRTPRIRTIWRPGIASSTW